VPGSLTGTGAAAGARCAVMAVIPPVVRPMIFQPAVRIEHGRAEEKFTSSGYVIRRLFPNPLFCQWRWCVMLESIS
jgi:hypothetical protein